MKTHHYIELLGNRWFRPFVDEFGYKPVVRSGGLYLVKRPLVFFIYEHLGEIHFDVYNYDEQTWGWGVSSIILDRLSQAEIDAFLQKHNNAQDTLQCLSKVNAQLLLAKLDILYQRLPSLLAGHLREFKEFFHPLSARLAELDEAVKVAESGA